MPTAVALRQSLSNTCVAHSSAASAGIRIAPADDKGLGGFCTAAIEKGAVVGHYLGEILSSDEVGARYWATHKKRPADRRWARSRRQRGQGLTGDYLFDVGDDLFIDGEDADVANWCRFINHAPPDSLACNLETHHTKAKLLARDGEKADPSLWFVAIRDIAAGEELAYDYGDVYWEPAEADL